MYRITERKNGVAQVKNAERDEIRRAGLREDQEIVERLADYEDAEERMELRKAETSKGWKATLPEMLEAVRDDICNDICKYNAAIEGAEDRDGAMKELVERHCAHCAVGWLY